MKEEKTKVGILANALVGVAIAGVNGMDLLETFLNPRIQPLQAKAHPMWLYEGPSDPARVHPEDLGEKHVGTKIRTITSTGDTPRGARMVPAYAKICHQSR